MSDTGEISRPAAPPRFDEDFRRRFETLLAWRRDVRRFRQDPVDPAAVEDGTAASRERNTSDAPIAARQGTGDRP